MTNSLVGKRSVTWTFVAPNDETAEVLRTFFDGHLEFKSCDVDVMDEDHQTIISKGQILLADDLEGAGHVWQFIRDKNGHLRPWIRCYIHLGEEYDHFMSRLIGE